MATVGILINPLAGKDVRRLFAMAGHTPDEVKVGLAVRGALAALASGARVVAVAEDGGRLGQRVAGAVAGSVLVSGPQTGSALDTRRAASALADLGCQVVMVIGGDGTCRDVVIGWPDVVMVPISTGTNNVFPRAVDGTSAGTAAGLVAAGRVPAEVTVPNKRLVVEVERSGGERSTDVALVDVAVLAGSAIGARAVVRPESILAVVAAVARPASTGLSAIAGRLAPLDARHDGAVVVRLGRAGGRVRRLEVPIVPGASCTLEVESVEHMGSGAEVTFDGPCVLAFDGERERVVPPGAHVRIRCDWLGPRTVDVDRTLTWAACHQLFDVPSVEVMVDAG